TDWRVRKEAANLAPAVGPKDELIRLLERALAEKEDIGLRNAAVEAMIAMGPDALSPAIALLGHLDADGRKLVVEICAGIPDPRGVEALTSALADEDANVRTAAAEALGRAGLAGEDERESAIASLAECLASNDLMLTLAALDALARLDAHLPWTVFEPLANQPLYRRHAIVAASRSREEAALIALVFATGDASPTVAREAAQALASWLTLEPLEADVLARARKALQSSSRAHAHLRKLANDTSDPRARGAGLVALGLLQDVVDLPALVAALDDEEVDESAVQGLELFGGAAAASISRLVSASPPRTRATILSMLPRLSPLPDDTAILSGLRGGLLDPEGDVVLASIKGLGLLGEPEDLERLIPLTWHEDPRASLAAVTALAALGVWYPDEASTLLASIDPTGAQAIAGAALVPTRAGEKTDEGVAFLERAIAHRDPRARRVAVEALALLGGKKAGENVAFALADEEREVRLAAVRALGQLGRAEPLANLVESSDDHELVVSALRALGEADKARGFAAARARVHSPSAEIACAAVEAIDRFGSSGEREDALFDALGHPDSEVVKLALSSLATNLDARALARLGMSLDHESWEVRRLASELLGQSKSPSAQALLRARLEREKEPVVRDALTNALSLRPPPGFEG
ncbi:MAG: repeat protein, partial [Myxococcaceae bacterium]|nr:repeat protein [Myxococcaceae bacterium]